MEAPLRARDGAAAAVLGLAAAFVVWASLYVAADARADPLTYERVHGMSAEVYVAGAYRSAALAVLPLGIALLTLFDRKRRRLWRRATFACLLVGAVWSAYGFWEWAETGFDHP